MDDTGCDSAGFFVQMASHLFFQIIKMKRMKRWPLTLVYDEIQKVIIAYTFQKDKDVIR